MMTKEEYERAVALRSEGLTIKETAQRLGHHPATIGRWIRAGGPPDRRTKSSEARVLNAQWADRVAVLLESEPRMFGTAVYRVLKSEGFRGSYSSVVRHLRAVRGPGLPSRNDTEL